MPEVTFRDFAGAVMSKDTPAAARVLGELLALDPPRASAAATFFMSRAQADPSFMMKAMGLRAAVTSGDEPAIRALLAECFGLSGADCDQPVAELRRRYPA